jgi:AmmeMemoRadiSam system protein A
MLLVMAPMSSVDALRTLLGPHRRTLHALAHDSINYGLDRDAPRPVCASDFAPALQTKIASFVTLRLEGNLRGCVGTAIAARPLVEDIWINAYGAAFHDLRFPPLARAEFQAVSIELSVLSAPEPMPFTDEQDLRTRLVPGRDGLILEHHGGRGLFLPQVWEMLPDPAFFLDHLKAKARLPARPLDPAVRVLRFEAVKLPDHTALLETAAD